MTEVLNKLENAVRYKGRPGVAGIWLDEHELVEAARKVRESGYEKVEAISPYPIHGIDEALAIPRSYIPYIAFVAGAAGCLFGIWFTWWASAVDWPILIGGKPMWSLAAFIPVIFECTILFAALTSVAAMIIINGLPKVDPPVIDPDLTSHKFALFIYQDDKFYNAEKIEQLFRSLGATDVKKAEF